ncbi:MAG: RNA polymerase sigma-70 factor [Bacteroidia bacterium]|nr:RNA polymerase sigma-70 factor [Bacteroidia bacterium]
MEKKGRDNKKFQGDPEMILLEHIFKQLHAPLFFYALKFIDDKEVAKDLVQDAFLTVINKKPFSGEIVNLNSYLYICVRNNCMNYLNHKAIENSFHKETIERSKREIEFYDTHKTFIEKEQFQQVMDAIEQLPEHYRIPFKMSRLENLKTKEIAEKLDIPLRSVETQIYRALNLLREKLNGKITILFSMALRVSK